jgi:hypothetical protein
VALVGFLIREVVEYNFVVGHQVIQGEAGANEPRNWHWRLSFISQPASIKIPMLLISVLYRHLLESPPSWCTIKFLFFSIRVVHFSLKLGFRF